MWYLFQINVIYLKFPKTFTNSVRDHSEASLETQDGRILNLAILARALPVRNGATPQGIPMTWTLCILIQQVWWTHRQFGMKLDYVNSGTEISPSLLVSQGNFITCWVCTCACEEKSPNQRNPQHFNHESRAIRQNARGSFNLFLA